ncbi:flagellar export protein FliJ [Oceanisphaera profunda]|uniref:Flagellar FliJ protein n=1 Tax=Oceanisphaera profunda TaxID=1416627 RepID=A0A1Y0D759_9GAMM|nr:flagellar export protein FliJ [Oceanisphaera profunda]ART83378.1 flagellar export protein FliJ [Oceanisphaera profunda]
MSRALHLLLNQLDIQERKASAELGAAQLQLQQLAQQQQTLSEYQRNYSEEFQNRGREGLSANQFSHFQGFINKLEVAQEQQQDGLKNAREQMEKSRTAWMAVRARKQAIETLLEREAERKQIESNRQEQKMLDNLAIYRFYNQKKR